MPENASGNFFDEVASGIFGYVVVATSAIGCGFGVEVATAGCSGTVFCEICGSCGGKSNGIYAATIPTTMRMANATITHLFFASFCITLLLYSLSL